MSAAQVCVKPGDRFLADLWLIHGTGRARLRDSVPPLAIETMLTQENTYS